MMSVSSNEGLARGPRESNVLEDKLDPDDRKVFDLAFEILGAGPLPAVGLISAVRSRGGFEGFEELSDEGLVGELVEILTKTDRFWARDIGTVHRADLMLDGVVFTHRLSDSEVERGAIQLVPDIGLIDFDLDHDQEIILSGQVVETEVDIAQGWYAWALPDGLPADCHTGDLIAIRRAGGRFELLHGGEVETMVARADTDELVALIRNALRRVHDDGIGMESDEIVMAAILDSPSAFRSVVPPIVQLLEHAGADRHGDYFGPADIDWEPPGAHRLRMRRDQIADKWGFDECCQEAYDVVNRAWLDHLIDNEPRFQPSQIRAALAHNAVSLALLDELGDSGVDPLSIIEFLSPLIDSVRSDTAPCLYMLGRTQERVGMVAEAEASYERAMTTDPEFAPPFEALGVLAFERGDIARSTSLLDRATGKEQRHPIAELLSDIAPQMEEVGRNEQCPCGSGRKFKACHLGKPLIDDAAQRSLLLHKVLMHLHRRDIDVIDEILTPFDPEHADGLFHDEFVSDVAVFEGGVLADFLDSRAEVLPADDLSLGAEWLATPRRLFEVVAADPGLRLDLRDIESGDRVIVAGKSGSATVTAGQCLLARIVGLSTDPMIVGLPLEVPPEAQESLREIVGRGAGADDLVAWFAAL